MVGTAVDRRILRLLLNIKSLALKCALQTFFQFDIDVKLSALSHTVLLVISFGNLKIIYFHYLLFSF